jgi:hypothetical protein
MVNPWAGVAAAYLAAAEEPPVFPYRHQRRGLLLKRLLYYPSRSCLLLIADSKHQMKQLEDIWTNHTGDGTKEP